MLLFTWRKEMSHLMVLFQACWIGITVTQIHLQMRTQVLWKCYHNWWTFNFSGKLHKTREVFLLCPSCVGSFKSLECCKSTDKGESQLFFNQFSEKDNVCMEILSPPPARRLCSEVELDKIVGCFSPQVNTVRFCKYPGEPASKHMSKAMVHDTIILFLKWI